MSTTWQACVGVYDRPTGTALRELVFPNIALGTTTLQQLQLTNISASPVVALTNVRLIVKLITGGFTGGTNEQGQEAVTGQWLQARVPNNAFQPIGGPYGNGSPVGNYLPLPDLAAGASVNVDVQLVIPPGALTARYSRFRLGVSYTTP